MIRKKDVTIYDIAKALKLSPSTVSRGLRDHKSIRKETRRRILAKAMDLGYQHNTFASNLRSNRTYTIGLILPRLDSYFMSTVISGIEKVANKRGYNLVISQSEETYEKEKACISTMFNLRVDGLLFSLAYETKNLDHLKMFQKRGIPVIFFDRVFDQSDHLSIVIDNFKAGFEVTNHMIEQGCKRIVHLGGDLKRNVYRDRYNGYRKALKDHNLPFDPNIVSIGPMNEEAGIRMVDKMIRMEQIPDGIFASNDVSAVACICRLKQNGFRIPEDVAVAGFNNGPISKVVDPNLTTVNYPGEEMGEVAITTLVDMLEDSLAPSVNTIVLKHQLIVRASTQLHAASQCRP